MQLPGAQSLLLDHQRCSGPVLSKAAAREGKEAAEESIWDRNPSNRSRAGKFDFRRLARHHRNPRRWRMNSTYWCILLEVGEVAGLEV